MDKIVLNNGIFTIGNDVYHASSGLSRSALMEFKKSPYHYEQKYLIESEPKEPTTAMVMGNLIHTLTLEPDLFADEFVLMPKFDRRTNVGKLAYNAFQSTMCGRIAITDEDYTKALAIAKAVREHELGSQLLNNVDVEKSIYFTHKQTGIQCKCRPDAMSGSIVIDLKTTADASFRAFQSSAFKYGYYLQAAMIKQGLDSLGLSLESFVFIAAEKELPYAVGIYTLDEEAILWGENQFNEIMFNYASCLEKNKWPGYPLMNLTLPNYANYVTISAVEFEHE